MAYRTEGGEFLINQVTAGDQTAPAVARLSSGGFVVAWTGTDSSAQGIRAQIFDATGGKIGTEFLVNTDEARTQRNPALTGLSDGGFEVIWEAFRLSSVGVQGQRFDGAGVRVGGEQQQSFGARAVFDLEVETLASGNLAMAWSEAPGFPRPGDSGNVIFQITTPSGAVIGTSGFANTTTAGAQSNPGLAVLGSGNIVVTWTTQANGSFDRDIVGQVFDGNGAKLGGEFPVNSTSGSKRGESEVIALSGGGFVVVWRDDSATGGDGSGSAIKGQIFDASGARIGTEFLVNTVAAGSQQSPDIVALSTGGFFVAWADNSGQGGDASGFGIKGQEFSATGDRVGSEILINTATGGDQTDPAIEVLAGDRLVVSWTDASGTGGDASGTSIKAQVLVLAQEINGTAAGETITGTADGEIINGLGGDDQIAGLGGNDLIDGGAGADAMSGGAGNDVYVVDDAGDAVVENPGEGGADEVRTSLGGYRLGANVEQLVGTNSAGQLLLGNELNNVITGAGGRDRIEGGAGADIMTGSAGDDTYVVDTSADQVFEFAGDGTDTVFSFGDYQLTAGSQIEYLAAVDLGATTPMHLVGNEFNNELYGNAGRNRLEGGGGFDILRGFGGDDTYVVDSTNDFIVEQVGDGTDTAFTFGSYTLNAGAEVEYLAAVDVSQTTAMTLVGNEFNNQIYGNAGRNRLEGGGGADVLQGYGGDDTYVVVGQSDTVVEFANDGTDTVYTFGSYALAAGSAVEYLSAVDHAAATDIQLSGNELGNQVYGNAGANVIDGGAGGDTLLGFGGADLFAFTTALGAGNVDRIGDFAVGSDRIALDDAVFTGLARGALENSAFRIGTAATDADDRIIYNPETGALMFDPDGTGAAEAVQFAALSPGMTDLSAAQFVVI